MTNISIGRYSAESTVAERYAGWIEDAERTWIIFLDPAGKPALYWREREPSGAVIGDPLVLDPEDPFWSGMLTRETSEP
jgi:hypothetical protein